MKRGKRKRKLTGPRLIFIAINSIIGIAVLWTVFVRLDVLGTVRRKLSEIELSRVSALKVELSTATLVQYAPSAVILVFAEALTLLALLLKDRVFFGEPNIKRLKSRRRVRALINLLRYKKGSRAWFIRVSAADALGDIGNRRAIRPLVKALYDSDSSVRKEAASALRRLGWRPTERNQTTALYWAMLGEWNACAACGPAAVHPLLWVMQEDHEKRQYEASKLLIGIGSAAAGPLGTLLCNVIDTYINFGRATPSFAFTSDKAWVDSAHVKRLTRVIRNCSSTLSRIGGLEASMHLVSAVLSLVEAYPPRNDEANSLWLGMMQAKHTRNDVVKDLEKLSGKKYGADIGKWTSWLAAEMRG